MSSNHDTHDTHDSHDPHAAEHSIADQGPPAGPAEPVTPIRSYIWPAAIALLVFLMVAGPVFGSFDRFQPAAAGAHSPAGEGEHSPAGGAGDHSPDSTPGGDHSPESTPGGEHSPESTPGDDHSPEATPGGEHSPAATPANNHGGIEATVAAVTPLVPNRETVIPLPTDVLTAVPTNVRGNEPATATLAPVEPPTYPAPSATTAAARPPTEAEIRAGTPRTVTFAGQEFRVAISDPLLPDWTFSREPGVVSWVSGTVINYVFGISYTQEAAGLFAAAKAGDTIRLARADGTVYAFQVDAVRRVARSDTSLLAQDHPALTLLLLGDPATDRALVQGRFVESGAVR